MRDHVEYPAILKQETLRLILSRDRKREKAKLLPENKVPQNENIQNIGEAGLELYNHTQKRSYTEKTKPITNQINEIKVPYKHKK